MAAGDPPLVGDPDIAAVEVPHGEGSDIVAWNLDVVVGEPDIGLAVVPRDIVGTAVEGVQNFVARVCRLLLCRAHFLVVADGTAVTGY